jgi:hypothetical protein
MWITEGSAEDYFAPLPSRISSQMEPRGMGGMDGLDKLTAAGSGVLIVGMTVLFLAGLVVIVAGGSSESVLQEIPAVAKLARPDSGETNRRDEQPPGDAQRAVLAAEASPDPSGEAGGPSPTSTPAPAVSEFPVAQAGARTLNDTAPVPRAASTPTPAGAPGTQPTRTPRPPAPTTSPRPAPTAEPAPEPTAEPTPVPTPRPESCAQAESGIVIHNHRILIERGSVLFYGAGLLALATADGPVTLEVTADTAVVGDLGLARQVRVEAHMTGNERVIARAVEVLCSQG